MLDRSRIARWIAASSCTPLLVASSSLSPPSESDTVPSRAY